MLSPDALPQRAERLHPALQRVDLPEYAILAPAGARLGEHILVEPLVAAIVLFDAGVDPDARLATLDAAGVQVINEMITLPAVVVEGRASVVRSLVDEAGVEWVEPPLPKLTTMNAEARITNEVNQVQAAPYNLSGQGVRVMVLDGGSADAGHPDFGGRLTQRDPNGVINHATHVAGTIAGSGAQSGGASSNSERGVAPNALIDSYALSGGGSGVIFYENPFDIESDYIRAFGQFGADLSNNSIGSNINPNGYPCSLEGDYGLTAALIDSLIHDGGGGAIANPVRVVWSAGNERQGGRRCGSAATIPPPATNKNALVVGAINSDTVSPASFTSFGPTDDGRLKPDVTASGCQASGDFGIRSTEADGGYYVTCGTSMSGPVAAGVMALALEDYRARYPELGEPRNSTMKAFVIHGAEDIGRPGPDYENGYGNVSALNTIDTIRGGDHAEGTVTPIDSFSGVVNVPNGQSEFKLTLVWDDAPASPFASATLVNDLDLVVISPSGERFYPWTLDPSSFFANAVQTSVDRVNNVEQVQISNPEAGTWTVEVVGFDMETDSQSFSLVSDFDVVESLVAITNGPAGFVQTGEESVVSALVLGGSPASVNALFRADPSGPVQAIAMTSADGAVWSATLPPTRCGDQPGYAVETRDGQGQVIAREPTGINFIEFLVGEELQVVFDDVESVSGWTTGLAGDTATSGVWARGVPEATFNNEGLQVQAGSDNTPGGQFAFATGPSAGSGAGADDIDNGFTTLLSPAYDLAAYGEATMSFALWYSNAFGAEPNADTFRVDVSGDGGGSWTNALTVGPAGAGTRGGWLSYSIDLDEFVSLTSDVRVRFVAEDGGSGSLVEAALDDISIDTVTCQDVVVIPPCPGDANEDGVADLDDLLEVVLNFGVSGTDRAGGDVTGDGTVDLDDLLEVVLNFGVGC